MLHGPNLCTCNDNIRFVGKISQGQFFGEEIFNLINSGKKNEKEKDNFDNSNSNLNEGKDVENDENLQELDGINKATDENKLLKFIAQTAETTNEATVCLILEGGEWEII